MISEAGTDSQTICGSGSAIAAIIYQFPGTANASVTGLPAGVTSHWDGTGNTLTISGTPAASGTFAYTVTADGSSTVGGKITVIPDFTQANPAVATICYNATHTFTVAAATGGSGTLTYQWQSSSDNSTWSNISGAISANYTTAALTANTYYRRQATRTTCGGTITSTSALITVTANFTQANPAAATICYNATHTFTLAAATGGSGTLTYQWQSSTNGTSWSNISGATSANYTTPDLTASTYYRRQATRTTCCVTITSASALVTFQTGTTCCGAYIASGVWKVFMCHNLGATTSADPFTPSYQINRAYYQWGKKDAVVLAPTNSSGAEPGYTWNSSVAYGYFGNNTSDTDITIKSIYDPCPDGYRVPSQDEWYGVYNYNTRTHNPIGIWTLATNSWSGTKFGDNLFLPAAGYRYYGSGVLEDRGRTARY